MLIAYVLSASSYYYYYYYQVLDQHMAAKKKKVKWLDDATITVLAKDAKIAETPPPSGKY